MNQNPSPLSTLTPLQKAHYVLNSFLEIQRIADETYELGGFVLEDLKQLIDTLSRLEPAAVSSENDKLIAENEFLRRQLSQYRHLQAVDDSNIQDE